jgi:hypothetical protein
MKEKGYPKSSPFFIASIKFKFPAIFLSSLMAVYDVPPQAECRGG